MMKAMTRGAMNALVFIFMLPFLILFGALMLLISPIYIFTGIWNRLELWAYYDGDEKARNRDRWRYS